MKTLKAYLLLFLSTSAIAQIGGTRTFSFLDLSIPARANALGSANIAIWDKDVNLSINNPALLNSGHANQLAFNYVNFVSDINYGNIAYAHQIKKHGTFGVGLQFFNHGKFDGRDEFDVETGTFKASDYALNLGFAKTLNEDSTFSLGIGLKTIYSHYDAYTSFANAIDVGLTYHNKKQLTISILAKNYGRQWKSFSENSPKEELPTNIIFGISKKVPKAPFRIIAQYDQLLKWDLTYVNPASPPKDIDPFTNKPIVKDKKELRKEKFAEGRDKFGRHITIGAEILLGTNFTIRIAYNFKKGKEMALPDVKKANGLSVGLGFKVYKFHFDYAYSKYALNGNTHTFGITTNLKSFTKKNS